MKVLVNRCFGGFGLSRKAIEELRKLGHEPSKLVVLKGEMYPASGQFTAQLNEHEYNSYQPENCRADPLVVSVVERLGEEADGTHADIEVVEIPDGVQWEIDEYDGRETIDEVHRSW